MKKRISGALLTLCLLLGLLPAGALRLASSREAGGRGTAAALLSGTGRSAPEPPEAVYGIDKDCTTEAVYGLKQDSAVYSITEEAAYQTAEGGEWVRGTLAEACANVYEGGTVEVLRDIKLEIGLTVTKSMTITSVGDTPYTVTYSPQGRNYPNYGDQDHLINATDAGELYLENIILDGGMEEGETSKAELVRIERSQLTLGSGAILQNNDNTYSGGGLFVRDGTAVMLEGSVIRNCRGTDGGGARVTAAAGPNAEAGEQSSLILKGGIIEDCEAAEGGGVLIQAGGQFKGPLEGEGGAGVGDSSELRLYSGSIRRNKASGSKGSGGGIYIKEKAFGSCHVYMDGATIEENTAKFGGGINIYNGKVHLEGGAITKNHAELYGGGIYVTPEQEINHDIVSECDVILCGAAVVDGNTSTDSDPVDRCFYNVYLEGSEDYPAPYNYPTHPMTVEAPLTDGASIGVSRWLRPDDDHPYRVVAKPAGNYTITPSDLKKFYSDDPKYTLLLESGNIVMTMADVVFDNQGHGAHPKSQHLDDNAHLVEDPGELTERGYSFGGWFEDKECTEEKQWDFGANEIVNLDGAKPLLTLYAKWDLNHYRIEYDVGQDGVNNEDNPDEYTVKSGEITLKEPVKEGYRFLGWKLVEVHEDEILSTSPARSAAFAPIDTSVIPAGSIGYRKFMAIWKKNPPYTVTYKDGTGGTVFSDLVFENLSENAATPSFHGTPTRDGYAFLNWDPEVAPTVTEDVTYTAQWEELPRYTVTYKDGAEGKVFADQVTENVYEGTATPPFDGTPEREGYTFLGWDSEVAPTVAKNVVYTAQWEPIPYTITYELNGGTNAKDNPESYTIESETITLQDPVKENYTFQGWTWEGQTEPQKGAEIPKGSTGNKLFTALWEPVPYTITYELNGGTNAEGNPESYTIESETITLQDPVKENYTFQGWTWKGQTEPQKDVTIPQGSTGNKAFTALWEENAAPKPPDPPGPPGGGDDDDDSPPVNPDPGEEPPQGPGTEPPQDPGAEPEPEPGTEPAPDPGTEPIPDPGTEPEPEPEPVPSPKPDPMPQTGDPTHTALWAGCALAALAGIILVLRPQRRRR